MTAISIRFTPAEWEIIKHRLGAGDAVVECLTDVDEPNFTEDELELAIRYLDNCGEAVEPPPELAPAVLAVLEDCLDGSTFFAGLNEGVRCGEVSRGTFAAYHKAARRLEDKMRAVGIDVMVPRS